MDSSSVYLLEEHQKHSEILESCSWSNTSEKKKEPSEKKNLL